MADFFNYLYTFYYFLEGFFKSPVLKTLKIISIIISFLLLLGIIFTSLKSRLIAEEIFKVQTFLQGSKYEKKRISKIWKKILKLVQLEEETSYKLALLLADELLNEVLERSGWPGKNLEERLAKINPVQLPQLEKIKVAHFSIQKFSQEPSLPLSKETALEILKVYEKTLQDLDIID